MVMIIFHITTMTTTMMSSGCEKRVSVTGVGVQRSSHSLESSEHPLSANSHTQRYWCTSHCIVCIVVCIVCVATVVYSCTTLHIAVWNSPGFSESSSQQTTMGLTEAEISTNQPTSQPINTNIHTFPGLPLTNIYLYPRTNQLLPTNTNIHTFAGCSSTVFSKVKLQY